MSVDERIEALCRVHGDGDFADLVKQAGAREVLDAVTAAVRSGGADTGALERDLDTLDDLFTKLGIDGLTGSTREFTLTKFGDGRPEVQAWVCPLTACSRVESATDPAVATPNCLLAGAPLKLITIRL